MSVKFQPTADFYRPWQVGVILKTITTLKEYCNLTEKCNLPENIVTSSSYIWYKRTSNFLKLSLQQKLPIFKKKQSYHIAQITDCDTLEVLLWLWLQEKCWEDCHYFEVHYFIRNYLTLLKYDQHLHFAFFFW